MDAEGIEPLVSLFFHVKISLNVPSLLQLLRTLTGICSIAG
jgi:hypothetical protein